MIPIKIQCGCGQKYAFDVEPVNGQMSHTVACPVCGMDGTPAANEIIAQTLTTQSQTAPAPSRMTQPSPLPTRSGPSTPLPLRPAQAPKVSGKYNLGLGILGAIIGAGVGVGAMYGFFSISGFRFPLLGVGIGLLTGAGARILAKGSDVTLGAISGLIALLAVLGTLYLMYGTFPAFNIVSVIVSVYVAYRVAAK